MKFLFLFLHVQSIKCRTVAFMTLIQSSVKIHPACPFIWAVNRNGHTVKSYFYAHYAGSVYCTLFKN